MDFGKKEVKKKYDKPLVNDTLMYVGREYHKTFDNDDGSKTKSYKYKFKKTEQDQYPHVFWGYDTTKGAETLDEGEFFFIGYVEKPIVVEGKDRVLKSAKFFSLVEEESVTSSPSKEVKEVVEDDPIKAWIAKLEPNKEGFLAEFTTSDGFDKFLEWAGTDKCETKFFEALRQTNMSDEDYKARVKSVYDIVINTLNEVI